MEKQRTFYLCKLSDWSDLAGFCLQAMAGNHVPVVCAALPQQEGRECRWTRMQHVAICLAQREQRDGWSPADILLGPAIQTLVQPSQGKNREIATSALLRRRADRETDQDLSKDGVPFWAFWGNSPIPLWVLEDLELSNQLQWTFQAYRGDDRLVPEFLSILNQGIERHEADHAMWVATAK